MAVKLFISALLSILLLPHAYAQKVEVAVQANSGLLHYSGNGAESETFFIPASTPNGYTSNNPYGNKNGFSYGFDVQAQYVNKGGFIMGLQGGYEVLKSKIDINSIYGFATVLDYTGYLTDGPIPTTGQTSLQDQDIALNPYIGYRLKIKNVKIDLMPGIDLGLGSKEGLTILVLNCDIFNSAFSIPTSEIKPSSSST